jgi:hypothetical protein
MNYNIATILAAIAILFVLLTYTTGAPLVPVARLLGSIIFGGSSAGHSKWIENLREHESPRHGGQAKHGI